MKYHYSQSQLILKKIKDSKNILINVHKNPDLDSLGSALAMFESITYIKRPLRMGKDFEAEIVCPERIPQQFFFLKNVKKIQTVDFSKFNYSPYDLFLILDTSSYDRVTGDKNIQLPLNLQTIVIDHHKTNDFVKLESSWYRVSRPPHPKGTLHGEPIQGEPKAIDSEQIPSNFIVLVDVNASATVEIIYNVIKDLRLKINETIATALFSGIAGDTVFFKYPKNPKTIFTIASDLLDKGADHKKLVSTFFDSNEFAFTKLLGVFLSEMKLEKRGNRSFVWAAIPYETFARFGHPQGVRETAADSFFRSIKGADFGIAMLETKKGELSVSFRSKDKIDVSFFAEKLGGGGHKNAAGCTVKGEFNNAVKTVLDAVSHYN